MGSNRRAIGGSAKSGDLRIRAGFEGHELNRKHLFFAGDIGNLTSVSIRSKR